MKKTLSLILAVCLFTWVGAQEDPAKDMKKVSRNIANYNLDPVTNADALKESVSLIEGVVKSSLYEKDGKAWLLYGNVYAEITNSQTQSLVLDPDAEVTAPETVVKTYTGYRNAISFAEKAYDKKDAVNGLKGVLPNMYYVANTILNRQDYPAAYEAYQAVTESEKLVEANGEEGIFPTEELQSAEFITGVCAYSAGKYDEAVTILSELKKSSYNDAGLYEYLFKTYEALGQKESASMVLTEGRTKFPNDKGLLFAEINDALGKGDLEALVEKLKVAMVAEPENISVPTTLGNVYDQLYQKSLAAGDKAAAQSHFDNAILYSNKALEINPNHFEALYTLGQIHYNTAAHLGSELNALADDYSKEGTKKYDAKKAEMMAQFDKALPYFEKAEMLNSEDSNTLLALREIYARKDNIEKSNEYKAKYERINGN